MSHGHRKNMYYPSLYHQSPTYTNWSMYCHSVTKLCTRRFLFPNALWPCHIVTEKIYITHVHITSSIIGPTGQCSVTVSHNFETNNFCFLMLRGHVTLSQKTCITYVHVTSSLPRSTGQCTVTVLHNFVLNCSVS